MSELDQLRLWVLFFDHGLMTVDQLEDQVVFAIGDESFFASIEHVKKSVVKDRLIKVRDAISVYKMAFRGGIPTELVERRAELDLALKGAVT